MNKEARTYKRIVAYLLDVMLVFSIISMVASIRIINPTFDKYEVKYQEYTEVLEKAYKEEIPTEKAIKENEKNIYYLNKYSVSTSIITEIALIGYFVFFQKATDGQTLGKKIMKIKVVSASKKKLGFSNYFLRLLPFYYVLIGNTVGIFLNIIAVVTLKLRIYSIVNSIIIYTFLLIAIASFVMICYRNDKRGLHDLIAKTKVIEE
jgi:uncharacterized RDD family membrane protein YckC